MHITKRGEPLPAPAVADTIRPYSATCRAISASTPPATTARLKHSLTGSLQPNPASSRSKTAGAIPKSSDREFEREQQEYEAEKTRREELRKSREATFERLVANAPAAFTSAQLRVLLRAIVNLDPYTFADDLADDLAGENENEQRTAEEVLLSTIDTLTDEGLTGFAIRLALAGHRGIPREGEFDFLAEAESVFTQSPPAKETKPQRAKKPTPIASAPKRIQKTQAKKSKPPKKKVAA